MPKSQQGRGSCPFVEKCTWAKYDRKHEGKCLVRTGNLYGCGKSGYIKRDCSIMKAQGRENAQAQSIYKNSNVP